MKRKNLFPSAAGKFVLSTVMIGLLAISAPQASHAGDEEDALKECVGHAVSDGIFAVLPLAAGCVGGYLSEKVNSDDEENGKASVQKFKGGSKKSFKQRRAR